MNAKNRHGTIYPYFYCQGRARKGSGCNFRAVLIDQVEREVELAYGTLELTADERADLTRYISDELQARADRQAAERDRQQRRIEQLDGEQLKLLQAHYADAIPLELMRSEQARIHAELQTAKRLLHAATAEHTIIAGNIDPALRRLQGCKAARLQGCKAARLQGCKAAYMEAGSLVRRQMNQAFFDRILVFSPQQVTGQVVEEYELLLHEDVRAAAFTASTARNRGRSRTCETTRARNERTPSFAGRGSKYDWMVDLTARFLNPESPEPVRAQVEDLPIAHSRPSGPLQRQVRLEERELLELIASYLDGSTVASLARQYGVNESTVHAHLNRRGVRRHAYRALSPDQIEEAAGLYEDGWTINRLAAQFGVAHQTMRRALHAAR